MKLKIIAVGKLKKGYTKDGVCDYSRRLSKYTGIEIIEVKDEKPGKLSDLDIKKKEGERILSAIGERKDGSFAICLDINGSTLSTEQLSEFIRLKKIERVKEILFIIGGSVGICENVLKDADMCLSLSKLTLPHELARLFLLEQLYRAEKILAGEPYHK